MASFNFKFDFFDSIDSTFSLSR